MFCTDLVTYDSMQLFNELFSMPSIMLKPPGAVCFFSYGPLLPHALSTLQKGFSDWPFTHLVYESVWLSQGQAPENLCCSTHNFY